MLQPKSTLLQIRIEPELLDRFKKYCDDSGFSVSPLLRKHIEHICDQHENKLAAKQQYKSRQVK